MRSGSTPRVIPELVSGIELGFGFRSWAEPLHCWASPGRPGAEMTSGKSSLSHRWPHAFSSQAGTFGCRAPSPRPRVAGLACGLSSPKRNLGSWSDFLQYAVLLKAELTLRQHLQKAQMTQQGSFVGAPWVGDWLLTSCQPYTWGGGSSTQLALLPGLQPF